MKKAAIKNSKQTKSYGEKKINRPMQRQRVSFGRFVEDTKVEYSKITWADRDTVIRATVIIIFIVIFTTLFIGTADISFTKGFFWLKSL